MVEVFKTNVTSEREALKLVNKIHDAFDGYTATFDLEDCDKVLRVTYTNGPVDSVALVAMLAHFGFQAEIMADEILRP